MYAVSDAFQAAIQDNTRKYHRSGTITTKSGTEYPFEQKDIVKGSGYITNQCCGSTEIEIGTVYAAEMGITLYTNIDRYSLEGGIITLFFHLDIRNGEIETIPMGVYEISEANRAITCMEIKAYDYMIRFEKSFDGVESSGTAFDLLSLACLKCDVELAHTKEEIEEMPNGSFQLSIYSDNDIETWRDLIYYTAQVLGCVATINREGKLELRKYGTASVMEITAKQRFTSSFSDFITRYTAVSSTNQKSSEEEYYALETDDGLTMKLGTNPLLQYGVQSRREEILKNILTAVSEISYVLFDSTTIGNPALDLGDVITFSGGQADSEKITCITGYTYRINGKHQMKCVGKNPYLTDAKSKNDKNIAGLISQIQSKKIVAQSYVNASDYEINLALTEIISIEFVSNEDTSAQFQASIMLNITADDVVQNATVTDDNAVSYNLTWTVKGEAEAELVYQLNDNTIETFQPKETWHPGSHLLSLFYPLDGLEANTVNEFKVFIKMNSGAASINRGCLVASIYGQGLAVSGKAEWDGYIRVEDKVTLFEMGFRIIPLVEKECMGATQQESIHSISQSIPLVHFGNETINMIDTGPTNLLQQETITPLEDPMELVTFGFSTLSVTETIGHEEEQEE